MSSELNRTQILSDLIGIGIFLSGKRTSFKVHPITPEKVIINAMSIAKSDRLIIQLLHTWILNHGDIIHVEALRSLMKDMDKVERAMIAGLLSYAKDRKFDAVIKGARLPLNESNHGLHKMMSFAAKIGQTDYDKNFKRFGIWISKLDVEPSKKMIPFEHVIELNPFIKCRYMFGVNWRADIAGLMTSKEYNPTEISKRLGCSYETAHRNLKDLKTVGWPRVSWSDPAYPLST